MNWPEDRVGALKKLWLEGQSPSQIAKQLGGGVTRNAVIGKISRLGLGARAAPSMPPRAVLPLRPSAASSSSKKHGVPVTSIPLPVSVAPELPGLMTLESLESHACRWPIGDPLSKEFSFCGRRTGGIYCIEHAIVAYQPKTKKRSAAYGAYGKYP